ncbi:hypothetical protein [Embleya sp. NPDC020630]|uniref:hypothetical protein n=1 Tax=Embleya sp. NPDC020630 TaxID=3363979 RepID=UPI0037939367
MKHAPSAMAAGEGPDGEPLVYVFYASGLVRRILQTDGGGPTESWPSGGVDHKYPYTDAGTHIRDLWTCLTGVLNDVPVGVFRQDEQFGANTYTFHALEMADAGKYRRYSWHHTVLGKQHVEVGEPFAVPQDFTVTAACETSQGSVVLWGKTSKLASAYCMWNVQDGLVGPVVKGPLETAVQAAFLGYDKSGAEHVMRLYAGADGKEESAYAVKATPASCVFTPLSSAPRFLAAAEPK